LTNRLYGLTGGGFLALIPAVAAEIVPVQKVPQAVSLVFVSMIPGGLLGVPISGLLRDHAGFTAAIEFAGATTVLSSLILLCLRQRRAKGKIFVKV
jgi:predicted MFS family arabinose efflux permease